MKTPCGPAGGGQIYRDLGGRLKEAFVLRLEKSIENEAFDNEKAPTPSRRRRKRKNPKNLGYDVRQRDAP